MLGERVGTCLVLLWYIDNFGEVVVVAYTWWAVVDWGVGVGVVGCTIYAAGERVAVDELVPSVGTLPWPRLPTLAACRTPGLMAAMTVMNGNIRSWRTCISTWRKALTSRGHKVRFDSAATSSTKWSFVGEGHSFTIHRAALMEHKPESTIRNAQATLTSYKAQKI